MCRCLESEGEEIPISEESEDDIATTLFPSPLTLQERIEDFISGGTGKARKGKGIEEGRGVLGVIGVDMDTENTTHIVEMRFTKPCASNRRFGGG